MSATTHQIQVLHAFCRTCGKQPPKGMDDDEMRDWLREHVVSKPGHKASIATMEQIQCYPE